jgi:hypothetical protein
MKAIISTVLMTIVIYFISWSIAYVWLVGSDLTHYWEYLRLAWTNPGETPAFLRMVSVAATILMLLLIFGFIKYRSTKT